MFFASRSILRWRRRATDRVHLIKLGGMAIWMGLEEYFVLVLNFLLTGSHLFGSRLNCIRREECGNRFCVVSIERLVILQI